MLQRLSFAPLILAAFLSPAAWAADTTPPTTPVVTDDGVYTATSSKIHATWTSSDPESGILEYQYLIRQDSTTGPIIVNWTSTGTTASVTRTGLSLLQGKLYYVGVKARNGVNLWSAVGYSNGIKVDTTAPSAPGLPHEGSPDVDYDADGTYTVAWPAAADAESGVAAYELQERIGTAGSWTTLNNAITVLSFKVTGRLHNTRYFYRVRAKNGAGLWGAWSLTSDGLLVDTTAPATVTVTDDGATTSSTTALHATWTASSDPESGIALYQYLIRQDSTTGPIIVNWTSVGLATQVTRTGLSLLNGKSYYIGVRVKNNAGKFSAARYSDGITVQATTPTAVITSPTQNQIFLTDDLIPFTGTATSASFSRFTIEYATAPPAFTLLTTGTTEVLNDVLFELHPDAFAPDTYTFRLTVYDQSGASSIVDRQIVLDHIQLTNLSIAPDTIVPELGERAGIHVTLSRMADVTIRIYNDLSRQLVRTLAAPASPAGPTTILWDGRNEANAIAAFQEAYYFTIQATDAAGRRGTFNDATNPLFGSPPSWDNPIVDTTNFSPYRNTGVVITYDLTDAARVNLLIVDFASGRTVRALLDQALRSGGSPTEIWDGRQDDGTIYDGAFSLYFGVPAAVPLYHITLQQAANLFSNFVAEAYVIQPLYREISQLHYTLGRPATVTLTLTDPNGNIVRTLLAGVSQPAGPQMVEWDGRTSAGDVVAAEGVYTVTLTGVDQSSGVSSTYRGLLTVQR